MIQMLISLIGIILMTFFMNLVTLKPNKRFLSRQPQNRRLMQGHKSIPDKENMPILLQNNQIVKHI